MFYIESFLPSPPLPHQRRVSNTGSPLAMGGTHRGGNSNIRLLCMVVTSPQYHLGRARHVKETWTRHCDRTVFLSSEGDTSLGEVIVVPQAPDYYQLWDKVIAGVQGWDGVRE